MTFDEKLMALPFAVHDWTEFIQCTVHSHLCENKFVNGTQPGVHKNKRQLDIQNRIFWDRWFYPLYIAFTAVQRQVLQRRVLD